MKIYIAWAILIVLVLSLMYCSSCSAQNVIRKGNTFVAQSKQKKEPTKTSYVYQDSTGIYPVYLSSNGKAFIIKVSKKTGKEYRKYLPKVTEQLNSMKNGSTNTQQR